MPPFPSGTVAFLFTDIQGSTALWEQDQSAMDRAVQRHMEVLGMAISAHGGVHFKTVGDMVQAAFPTAPQAVAAALLVQQALQREIWSTSGPINVRVALHAGEAVPDDRGDYLAAPLNRLSRLLAIGHGGQILLSQAVQQLSRGGLPPGSELRDLGEHRLRDLLDPERIYQLKHPDLPQDFPPLKSLDARPNNLPRQPTPFLGREVQVQEIVTLLRRDDVQLLTLTGPGGTGKTRLSLQVAADLLDNFTDGVYVVPLAHLTDPARIPDAIALALGLRDEGDQPLVERLQRYLAIKEILLVIDNVEHLVEATAPVVGSLLEGASRLKVLATSRVPLRVRAEQEYPVPPLGLPRRKPPPTLEQLSQFEAVRLFITRAQAVKPDFAIDNETAPAVAEICHRLDGLPLAIELAAARVRMLAPPALLARLEKRLPLLTGGARDAPARQRTLRDTIAWSYDLLEPEEQRLFRRLAVFAGGCTFDAAEAVGNHDGEIDTFAGLEGLVEHSLLRQSNEASGEPRFLMLETIREFAAEQLLASVDRDVVHAAHVSHFLALAEANRPDAAVQDQKRRLDRLHADLPNLRAAMAWALDHGEAPTALRIAVAIGEFWDARGQLKEGRSWLERALAACDTADPALRADALRSLGALITGAGEYAEAARTLEEALALYRELGDVAGTGWVLMSLGTIAMFEGDYARDDALSRDALAAFRTAGDDVGVGTTLANMASTASERGDPDEAEALAAEALVLLRRVGHDGPASMALGILGETAVARNEHDRAAARTAEALALARAADDLLAIGLALMGTGFAALARGDGAGALAAFREGLALFWEQGERTFTTITLEGVGFALAANGRAETTARVLGAAAAQREARRMPRMPTMQAPYDAAVLSARRVLGTDAYDRAWRDGYALPFERSVAEALETEGPAAPPEPQQRSRPALT